MVKTGCSIDGSLNEAKFSEPIPWIGMYVVAASAAGALAMAADLVQGFRSRRFWFPSNFFSFNATSLTIIAVATKLSVDLNTAMPGHIDQLAKLSSGVLICTVMSNSMPSLGAMENKDICMNMMALGILVVTVVVNICIQLGTGVIYLYWQEHAFIMFLMLLLLAILSFTSLTVPTTKKCLETKYNKRNELALKEGSKETDTALDKKLEENLRKFWMMAHTCCPQFVMGRSVTCNASGALCLLSAMTLAEAILRSYLMPWSFKFCKGESDYKWSTTLILLSQSVAVGVGTIAPAIRWFMAVEFRCPTRKKNRHQKVFKVEKYWLQCLIEMKECPLNIPIQHRYCRKLVHGAKNQVLDLCIGLQTGIVLSSKAIQCISIYFIIQILFICDCCGKLMMVKPNNHVSVDSGSEGSSVKRLELSRFVLHLEGEDELVELMMKRNCDATDHWMLRGRRKQPKFLVQLLEKSTSSEGFKGVEDFDSGLVPSLDSEEPPNCWALPIVTLTAIAVALPNISSCLIKQLVSGVHEGLMYVKLIEDNLDAKGESINACKAACLVWLQVDLYHKWLDVDLRKLSLQAKSAKEILERLATTAKNSFGDFKKSTISCPQESPSKWPIKSLAANSMYRISQTILQNRRLFDSCSHQKDERIFEAITVMVADILGACLTNLHHLISQKCSISSFEGREDSVREAVFLLGKTQRILKLLDQRAVPNLSTDQMSSIDEWRSFHSLKSPSLVIPSSQESDTTSSASSELCLTIQ